ncbi:hypothetical protein [Mariprofundus micogutta]|uniref:hypothetical protein n=1 Tax=Mariprofundus micogutta TaxID=1921010 RepID=UPI0009321141|nr:hypothetical protein [Mariprofundus micogutta]
MEAFTKRSQNLVQNNLWAEQRGSMNYKPCDQLSDSFTDWKILSQKAVVGTGLAVMTLHNNKATVTVPS